MLHVHCQWNRFPHPCNFSTIVLFQVFMNRYRQYYEGAVYFSTIVLFHVFINRYRQFDQYPLYRVAKFELVQILWLWNCLNINLELVSFHSSPMYQVLALHRGHSSVKFSTQLPHTNTSRCYRIYFGIPNILLYMICILLISSYDFEFILKLRKKKNLYLLNKNFWQWYISWKKIHETIYISYLYEIGYTGSFHQYHSKFLDWWI